MEGYSVNIIETSKELSARERIRMKDTTNAISLDEETQNGSLVITPKSYVVLDVHNEKSEDKDYRKYVIDDGTNKYVTGSESFWTSFKDIWDEMEGEEFELEIYRLESKNYKGKSFITCSII